MEAKRMMAIMGSPRRGGTVDSMMNLAVEEAKKAGYRVDVFYLYDLKLEYCKGCMGCKKSGVCVLKDDIGRIRNSLLECDVAVLAAPVYFANVPAVVKNLFDRLVGAVMDDNDSPIPKHRLSRRQKYVLMTACNTPFPFSFLCGQSSGALRAMREFFGVSGMKRAGVVVCAGTRGQKKLPDRAAGKIIRLIHRC